MDVSDTVGLSLENGGVPEAACEYVVGDNYAGDATSASSMQRLERSIEQAVGQALAPMRRCDGQPVDLASPAVPGTDHAADDLAVGFGHDQRVSVVGDEHFDGGHIVGDRYHRFGVTPQSQHGCRVGRSRRSHLDHRPTVAKAAPMARVGADT